MLRLTANLKGYGQLDVRYVRMQGDYPILRYGYFAENVTKWPIGITPLRSTQRSSKQLGRP